MYPHTEVEIKDLSFIESIEAPEEDTLNRPIFLTGITSDKGPETPMEIMGKKFFTLFGNDISFDRHGQALLQAANIINAGGKLFVKRVVAEDARLANILILGCVEKLPVQKTDSNGIPLFIDSVTGLETTDPLNNAPAMIQKCKISYEAKNISVAGDDLVGMAKVAMAENAHTNALGEDGKYPLFIIADNGRGASKKKFNINVDYNSQRSSNYTKYIFNVLENNEIVDSTQFAFRPNMIEKSSNISLEDKIKAEVNQVRCKMFTTEMEAFIENISYIIGDEQGEFIKGDILFGNDVYGNAIDSIVVDTNIALNNVYGISLIGGSNGEFGTAPIASATYYTEMVKVYNGQATDEIYDLDNHRIDFVVDANFPVLIKRAIEEFVTFREDCIYLRDLGTGLKSIEEIKVAEDGCLHNIFCATYHNSWDVKDPYSRKEITVTATYSIVPRLVKHFLNGIARPFAGMKYEITFSEVIENTVNFIPKKTPAQDQKKIMDNLRINYCGYYNGLLVLETEYTSQDLYTQLSFLNNVLAIQELIKAIRVRCPKIRYNFLDGDDLSKYQKDVAGIIDTYTHNFKTVTMTYAGDKTMEHNKIYYAIIEVTFRDFIQAEKFKLIALPTN